MYALLKSNQIVPIEEVDVAEVHDGDVVKVTWDIELLAQIGHARRTVAQYRPVLCPRCVILNENTFGKEKKVSL